MMLRVAMSSIKNELDFRQFCLKNQSVRDDKTVFTWCPVFVSILDQFASILTALETQNFSRALYTSTKNGVRTLIQSSFLQNIALRLIFGRFGSLQDVSKTSPRQLKTPQDGSKMMSRRFQDGSRRFSRRSPLLARNISQFTTHNEQMSVHKV